MKKPPPPFSDLSNQAAVPTLCPACERPVLQLGLPAGHVGPVCLCNHIVMGSAPPGEAS